MRGQAISGMDESVTKKLSRLQIFGITTSSLGSWRGREGQTYRDHVWRVIKRIGYQCQLDLMHRSEASAAVVLEEANIGREIFQFLTLL